MNELEIFLAAADIPELDRRAKYVETACGQDAGLRRRVEALLSAHDRSGDFLDVPALAQVVFGADETTSGPAPMNGAIDLSFLETSQKPGSLGRLGQYEVLETVGQGGFGIVLRAFDEALERIVAVKVLAPELAATSPARKRFLREAKAAAQIRHENVVQVHAVVDQPLPHLIMEFIPGETLQQRLDRTGPLDVPEIVRIGRHLALGLGAAHSQGFIHRDIKPSNIIIDEAGGLKVKITDFGLARAADDASLTQSGVVSGTPLYMSPEQARGETVDHRSDLFSLGSVLYALTSGRPPFRAATARTVLNRVSDDIARPLRETIPETPLILCQIIEKLHAKDRLERFQSAAEVADILAKCEAQLSTRGDLRDMELISPVVRSPRTPRFHWLVFPAALCIFAALAWIAYNQRAGVAKFEAPTRAERRVAIRFDPKEGWINLFDGQGLTGWKPTAPANAWRVSPEKTLVGTGLGYLLTDREFGNFRLVAEVRISAGGDSGVLFRCDPASLNSREPHVMEATINSSVRGNPATGTLTTLKAIHQYGTDPRVPANEWFTFEVIVDRDRISLKADDKTLLENVDGSALPKRGPIGLQCPGNGETVEVQSMWILPLDSE